MIEDKLRVLGRVIPIEVCDLETEEGMVEAYPMKILIKTELEEEGKHECLLHETMHLILALMGKQLADDVEEGFVATLSPVLYAVLKENPWIIRRDNA